MGEKKDPDLTAVVNPDMLTHNVKSPSGGMFLVSSTHIPSSVSANTATRILNYTGPLRLRGVGEMFHMRLTAHHFAGAFDKFQLKIGYKGSATYTESSDDFSDTACIATVDITSANLNLPADLDAFTTSPGAIHVPNPYDETQVWADVFVYFDFAGGNWSAYANDATSAFATGSINAAVDRDTAAGWSLDIYHSGYASDLFFGIDVLIDRAAVMLPLNWKLDGTVPPGVKDFRMNMRKSAVGTCSVTVMDDDNDYSLSALVTGTSATEWRLLAFRDQESRPIWSGIVDSVSHRQSSVSRTLETTILARDSASILDRILPIWDRGQVGTAAINEHIALDYAIAARASSARNLNDILNFGSRALTVGDSDVGYSSYNESASGTAYSHNDGSRSHIYSGTAVQIYNNEDSFGPNNAEDYWFGRAGTTYSLSRIHAIRNQAGKRSIYVERDGTAHTFSGTNNEDSTITTYLGLAVGDSLTLSGTGYDGTYVIASFSAHKNEDDEQFVEIEVTDSGAAAADDFFV